MFPSPLPLVHRSPSSLLSPWHGIRRLDRSRFHRAFSVNGPLGREENRMEVDRDKAREALRQLDQQLESLAQQETLPRKKRPVPPPFLGTARLLFTIDLVRIKAIFCWRVMWPTRSLVVFSLCFVIPWIMLLFDHVSAFSMFDFMLDW